MSICSRNAVASERLIPLFYRHHQKLARPARACKSALLNGLGRTPMSDRSQLSGHVPRIVEVAASRFLSSITGSNQPSAALLTGWLNWWDYIGEQKLDQFLTCRRTPVLRQLSDDGVSRREHDAGILHPASRHVLR